MDSLENLKQIDGEVAWQIGLNHKVLSESICSCLSMSQKPTSGLAAGTNASNEQDQTNINSRPPLQTFSE